MNLFAKRLKDQRDCVIYTILFLMTDSLTEIPCSLHAVPSQPQSCTQIHTQTFIPSTFDPLYHIFIHYTVKWNCTKQLVTESNPNALHWRTSDVYTMSEALLLKHTCG